MRRPSKVNTPAHGSALGIRTTSRLTPKSCNLFSGPVVCSGRSFWTAAAVQNLAGQRRAIHS